MYLFYMFGFMSCFLFSTVPKLYVFFSQKFFQTSNVLSVLPYCHNGYRVTLDIIDNLVQLFATSER